MPTTLDIITGALRKIGQYAPGETLSAADANDARDTLNGMLDVWSTEHLAVYNNIESIFTLVPGKNVYTVGQGGDFNMTRPLRIGTMYTRLTTSGSTVDFACSEISSDKYSAIGLKGQPGPWPKMAYYESGYPLASLYFWPVPQFGAEFHMWTDQLFTALNLNDPVSLPQGYFLALQYNLAVLLAPEYGVEPSPTVVRQAKAMKATLKALNSAPTQEVRLDAAMMSTGAINDAGWILSGGF